MNASRPRGAFPPRRTEFGSYVDHLVDAGGQEADQKYPHPPQRTERRGSDVSEATMMAAEEDLAPTFSSRRFELGSRENLVAHAHSQMLGGSGSADGRRELSASASASPHVLHASQSERRFVPPLMLLGPVLGVLFLTAGMATGMAIWIKTHMLPLSSDGVIYVREGAETEDNRTYRDPVLGNAATLRFEEQISHATTLSISSAISTLVGNSVFPLMGLVTYSLASSWLQLQSDIARKRRRSITLAEQLPTPLQYALLTQLCGANSFEAVYNTMRHMVHTKTAIPSILKQAFAWLTALLLLTTSIAGLDLYLHESMRTVQVLDINSTITMRNLSWGLNTSLCTPDTLVLANNPCLVGQPLLDTGVPTWAALSGFPENHVGPEGWLVANNASKDHGVLTASAVSLPDHRGTPQSLSFLVSPQVRTEDIFESASVGLSAQCRMITADCHPTGSAFDCAGAGEPQISVNSTTTTYASGTQGSNLGSHLFISDPTGTAMLGAQAVRGAQSNPLPVSALLTYTIQLEVGPSTEGFENFVVGVGAGDSSSSSSSSGASSPGPGQATWMYGALACSLALYELEMSYFNASYAFSDIRLADPGLLHALSGPLVSQAATDAVASSMARVAGRVPAQEFADLFGVALSYNVLAFVSGMLAPQLVPVNSWKPILASQYSVPALLAYLALLYAYAFCAIILFFWAWGMSSDCVEYDDPVSGTRRSVPAVVLAQRHLMDPSHIIALHLHGMAPLPAINASSIGEAHGGGFGRAEGPLQPSSCAMTPSTSITGLTAGCSAGHGGADLEKSAFSSAGKDSLLSSTSASTAAAAVRTISTDLLGLFDDSALAERVVVGLEASGRGFGVWPVQRAPGAVGQDERNRDSLLRTQNWFWHHAD